jgi:GntR family transcriptional regulator
MADRLSFLSAPLPRDPGIPLRAQVHSRVLDGIRSGILTPGSMVPTETELGQLLGVSRTVVREALMLLDEDGFIVSRRGIGRFVADTLPQIGLERIRPIEELLSTPDSRVELQRTSAMWQPANTTFVTEELGSPASWFVETIIRRDGEAVAHCQEWIALGDLEGDLGEGTVLAYLFARFGSAIGSGVLRLTLGRLGEGRAEPLGTVGDEPALIVTQTAKLHGAPFYLAKYTLRAQAGQLTVTQNGLAL